MKKDMNDNNENPIELNEENKILRLVDAHARSGGLSHSSGDADAREYDELFTLLTESRNSLKPDAALLRKTLSKLPASGTPYSLDRAVGAAVPSPYAAPVNWLYSRVSSWKVATPVIVLFIAVATIIGASPKKGQAPTIMPISSETIAPLSIESAEPSTFAMTEVTPDAASPRMMMAKMSQTTVPSTTPQNVGELIALLSNEADGDIDLGISDVSDPLYSFDIESVDAIEQPYDTQTI